MHSDTAIFVRQTFTTRRAEVHVAMATLANFLTTSERDASPPERVVLRVLYSRLHSISVAYRARGERGAWSYVFDPFGAYLLETLACRVAGRVPTAPVPTFEDMNK